jgi:hypothetical protein
VKKLIWLAALPLLVVTAPVSAGPSHEEMMEQFASCHICKNVASEMAELAPVMKHEMVAMNDGTAMVCRLTDATKSAKYHAAVDAMHVAGAETMNFTPEQVQTELCPMCQGIHALMSAGATLSHGKSADGSIMVITSADPAVQAQIASFQKMATEMMGS